MLVSKKVLVDLLIFLGTSNDPTEIQKAVAAKLGGGYDTILTLGAGLSGEAALEST